MPYTQVQFIAYEIDTSPANTIYDPIKRKVVQGTYLGLPDPVEDIDARCELMTRAIQTAFDNLPQASPPEAPGTTLKVFLVPEFFFRGAQGAYAMEDVQVAIARLQQIAADDQWADWVFAFGTILGTSAPAIGSPPVIDPTATKEIYNFTLIQKGGTASQGPTGARVVMKELRSGIDFIAENANPGGMLLGEVEHMDSGNGDASWPGREQQQVNYDGAGIFDLDGLTWGVEICLDHAGSVKRLQRSPQMPGASEVQIQLIPSGGMSIKDVSVVAKTGGFVFNCDGTDGGSSALKQVATPMVDIDELDSYPVDDSDITLADVSPPKTVTIAELYPDGAGQISIYPTQVLPPASTVTGSVVTLNWPASEDYQFKFTIIYDSAGQYKTLLVAPTSPMTNFHGNNYYVPLDLETKSKQAVLIKQVDDDVEIQVRVIAGSGGFDYAVWCKIDVPDFDFEGNAFQFNTSAAGAPPETIW